jgi:hypothetical protein
MMLVVVGGNTVDLKAAKAPEMVKERFACCQTKARAANSQGGQAVSVSTTPVSTTSRFASRTERNLGAELRPEQRLGSLLRTQR